MSINATDASQDPKERILDADTSKKKKKAARRRGTQTK
jgi:hypothetical protein